MDNKLAHIWVTKEARRLLRLISAHTGQPMQLEAERIFEQELKQIEEGRNEKGQAGTDKP